MPTSRLLPLAVAATLFLLTMEFAFLAARYATTPEERMGWTPEATVHDSDFHNARIEQAMDRHLADFYAVPARRLYNGGIVLFLAGLGSLVIPQRWTPAFVLAVAVVVLALLFELWTLHPWPRSLSAKILPFYDDVREEVTREVDALDKSSRGSIMRPERDR
jgi:hypothetical protein